MKLQTHKLIKQIRRTKKQIRLFSKVSTVISLPLSLMLYYFIKTCTLMTQVHIYQYILTLIPPRRPKYYLKLNISIFFLMELLETIVWTLSEGFQFYITFNLPNQLNKSTLCKMILLVALATNPCRIL